MGPTLVFLATLSVGASPSPSAEALTRRAIVEYNGGDFDEALAHAEQAYALRPAPGLLFNIGQCHRELHHWAKAADAFQAYLRDAPEAANRATVEGLIAEMQKHERADLEAHPPPPPPPLPIPVPATSAEAPVEPAASSVPSEPPKIAVLDLRPFGVSDDLARAVTAVVLYNVRKLAAGSAVVGTDELRTLLGLTGGKRLDCAGGACLSQLGDAFRAERFVVGSLTLVGSSYVLDVELLDFRTASVLGEGAVRFKKESGAPEAAAEAVRALFPK